MSLHALAYCERLFYLEEVEEIRVADARVYAGRTLHEQLDEEDTFVEFVHEDEELGLKGRIDALRKRDGQLTPYEHKRGRSRQINGEPAAWPSDRLQIGAYALLLEKATGERVPEGRIRYHADNMLVKLRIDEELRSDVQEAIERARALRASTQRPPITDNERLCTHCSLAPVCLPEETRKALDETRKATRLFPADDPRRSLHVMGHGTRVGRRGDRLHIKPREGEAKTEPIRELRSLCVHGFISVSSQALRLCADHRVAIHWFGPGGWYTGSFWRDDLAVQRRIRQYEALREPAFRLKMARRLVHSRAEGQLRFLLRATRGEDREEIGVTGYLDSIRRVLPLISRADSPATLLGLEGQAAAAYFAALPALISDGVEPTLHPNGRSKHPPGDRFNCLLSFGYGMLLREVVQAIRAGGLDAAFGFYHKPRSAAPPLALDLMELFRVPCVDMIVMAAVNRRQFDPSEDFRRAGRTFWLTRKGRSKLIASFEKRLDDKWRHPILEYSLSYRRHITLEVRLAEKEWSGEPGQFARTRIR